jgi:hypothetical protein
MQQLGSASADQAPAHPNFLLHMCHLMQMQTGRQQLELRHTVARVVVTHGGCVTLNAGAAGSHVGAATRHMVACCCA